MPCSNSEIKPLIAVHVLHCNEESMVYKENAQYPWQRLNNLTKNAILNCLSGPYITDIIRSWVL